MAQSIDTMPRPGGHYDMWRAANGFVFIAGQVPRDAQRVVIGESIEEQTKAVIGNLRRVLADAGLDLDALVQLQVYLADMADFSRFNAAYAREMGSARPPRTTIGCALNGVLVEMNAIAASQVRHTEDSAD